MKIRYDAKGNILAVGDDGCDWPGRVLELAGRDVPDDLLATFALGGYVVRDGRLTRLQVRPAAAASLATLIGCELPPLDLALFAAGALPASPAAASPAAKPAAAVNRKRARSGSPPVKKPRPAAAAKTARARLVRTKRGKG